MNAPPVVASLQADELREIERLEAEARGIARQLNYDSSLDTYARDALRVELRQVNNRLAWAAAEEASRSDQTVAGWFCQDAGLGGEAIL